MSLSHVCVTGGYFSGDGISTLVTIGDERATHWHVFVYALPGDRKVPSGGWVLLEGWLGSERAALMDCEEAQQKHQIIEVVPKIAEGTTFTAMQGMALQPVNLPIPDDAIPPTREAAQSPAVDTDNSLDGQHRLNPVLRG
jgi:hypothetical protein